jgi:Holliday junction resolvase RusA-like endonuclease
VKPNPATPDDAAKVLAFTITGRIVPAVRMTRRGKFIKPQAQAYLASKAAIGWQFKEQMAANNWKILPRTPLWIWIKQEVTRGLHRFDADNALKALMDAAQGIVFHNDCWVDEIMYTRSLGDENVATITILELDNGHTAPAALGRDTDSGGASQEVPPQRG